MRQSVVVMVGIFAIATSSSAQRYVTSFGSFAPASAAVTERPFPALNLTASSLGERRFSSSSSDDLHSDPTRAAESATTSYVRPVRSIETPRTMDVKYFLLNGLHLGMGMFDVAMTQRCIANNQCREGNPLMPSSLRGQLSINFGYIAYSSFISYRLKKRGSRLWWMSPAAGIASHGVGVSVDLLHQ